MYRSGSSKTCSPTVKRLIRQLRLKAEPKLGVHHSFVSSWRGVNARTLSVCEPCHADDANLQGMHLQPCLSHTCAGHVGRIEASTSVQQATDIRRNSRTDVVREQNCRAIIHPTLGAADHTYTHIAYSQIQVQKCALHNLIAHKPEEQHEYSSRQPSSRARLVQRHPGHRPWHTLCSGAQACCG